MRSIPRHMFVAFSALVFAATSLSAQNPGNAKKSSTVIVSEEVRASIETNAYDLVQALRPQWLRENHKETIRTKKVERPSGYRGDIEIATVSDEPVFVVFLDISKLGTLESLRDISVAGIGSLEFVSPAKATLRWGGGHTKGVIVVHSTAGGTSP
jgi:hypothetical protein